MKMDENVKGILKTKLHQVSFIWFLFLCHHIKKSCLCQTIDTIFSSSFVNFYLCCNYAFSTKKFEAWQRKVSSLCYKLKVSIFISGKVHRHKRYLSSFVTNYYIIWKIFINRNGIGMTLKLIKIPFIEFCFQILIFCASIPFYHLFCSYLHNLKWSPCFMFIDNDECKVASLWEKMQCSSLWGTKKIKRFLIKKKSMMSTFSSFNWNFFIMSIN